MVTTMSTLTFCLAQPSGFLHSSELGVGGLGVRATDCTREARGAEGTKGLLSQAGLTRWAASTSPHGLHIFVVY